MRNPARLRDEPVVAVDPLLDLLVRRGLPGHNVRLFYISDVPGELEPQCRQERTQCALRLIKHAFQVRANNLELPLFTPEALKRPLQCADGALRKNSALDPRTAAHIPASSTSFLSRRTALFITRGSRQ